MSDIRKRLEFSPVYAGGICWLQVHNADEKKHPDGFLLYYFHVVRYLLILFFRIVYGKSIPSFTDSLFLFFEKGKIYQNGYLRGFIISNENNRYNVCICDSGVSDH